VSTERELLAIAKRAASTSAALLRGAHAEQIRSKSNQFDLVTEWDVRSEEAIRGHGAFDETGAPLRVSKTSRLDQAMLTTGFPYDRATNPANNFAQWDHMQRVAGACRRLGCASLDLCFVARGWFDGYWERRLHPWDLVAGCAIACAAGASPKQLADAEQADRSSAAPAGPTD